MKNKLKELRVKKGLSQKELADLIPVNQTAISQWERGVTTPNPNALKKLCQIFNQTSDYFLEIDSKNYNNTKIPVFSQVAAGIPISAIEDIIDYEEISEQMASQGEYFGLRIKGNSMETDIKNNDIVIVRKQNTIESGEIAIVLIAGEEGTCKKIKKTPEGVMLISLNTAYEPIFYSNKQIEELPVQIVGKVVELKRKYEKTRGN